MKLKKILNNIRGIYTGHKRVLFAITILLLLALVVGVSFAVYKHNTPTKEKAASCKQSFASADNIFKREDNKAISFDEMNKNYQNVKSSSEGCSKVLDKEASKLSKLKFNYDMAIASYSMGDFDQSKKYATDALNLNDQVKDDARGESLPKNAEVKKYMEAVKNDTY